MFPDPLSFSNDQFPVMDFRSKTVLSFEFLLVIRESIFLLSLFICAQQISNERSFSGNYQKIT